MLVSYRLHQTVSELQRLRRYGNAQWLKIPPHKPSKIYKILNYQNIQATINIDHIIPLN